MSFSAHDSNELDVSRAFTKQSGVFDQLYGGDAIIQFKRQRVRTHIIQNASAGDRMLELNCGSGEDALYFAAKGFAVHGIDISSGMLEVFRKKADSSPYASRVSLELCSFTKLEEMEKKGPFDYIYSNFGGLNCTGDLPKVLDSFYHLVSPGGGLTLVVISKFCLWEFLLLFRGRFRTAFRRFFSAKGRAARVEGEKFRCWYYSPGLIIEHLRPEFELVGLEGLCTLVPPSYMEGFAEKHPRLFTFLKEKELKMKSRWPWNRMGDYFILSFRKK